MSFSANGVSNPYGASLGNTTTQNHAAMNNAAVDAVAGDAEQQKQAVPVAATPVSGADPQKQAVDEATIQNKVKQVNKVLADLDHKVEYRLVHEKGTDLLQLYDKENKKVIYQLPPEGIVEAAAKMDQMIKGLLIDLKR